MYPLGTLFTLWSIYINYERISDDEAENKSIFTEVSAVLSIKSLKEIYHNILHWNISIFLSFPLNLVDGRIG